MKYLRGEPVCSAKCGSPSRKISDVTVYHFPPRSLRRSDDEAGAEAEAGRDCACASPSAGAGEENKVEEGVAVGSSAATAVADDVAEDRARRTTRVAGGGGGGTVTVTQPREWAKQALFGKGSLRRRRGLWCCCSCWCVRLSGLRRRRRRGFGFRNAEEHAARTGRPAAKADDDGDGIFRVVDPHDLLAVGLRPLEKPRSEMSGFDETREANEVVVLLTHSLTWQNMSAAVQPLMLICWSDIFGCAACPRYECCRC
ncbi:hypothetical protein VTK26DRAFT_2788 [Humicola hyalothermophila]